MDNNVNQEGSNGLYFGISIYILHYPKGEKVAVSYVILKDIDPYDNYFFRIFVVHKKVVLVHQFFLYQIIKFYEFIEDQVNLILLEEHS